MKLTNRTIPQAKNYKCDRCKSILSHKEMYDEDYCPECSDLILQDSGEKK